MSFRSVIAPVLLLGPALALVGGCDRQVSSNEQATTATMTAAPAAPQGMPPAPGAEGKVDRSHTGEAAPTLGFEGPDGTPTSLAALRKAAGGKPMLVNLWATWCGPCVREMPTLDAAAAGIAVVPIAQDLDRASVTAFFAKRKFARLKPYLDPKTSFSVAYSASLPMSILFNSTGHEVWRSEGGMDWTSPAAKALLAEAR